jgi:purine-binding chemotaxis protein CheW
MEEQVREDVIQLVCFMFSNEQYAVEITGVREVIHARRVTPVPQMPDFALGVINIRGSIIPVFDLRKKFGLPEKPFDDKTKLLIVEIKGTQISFIVDEILDNVKIAKSSIDPSPHVKMNIQRECIRGLGQMENRMIIILDLRKVSESIDEDIRAVSRKEQR